MPLSAFAKLSRIVDDTPEAIGREAAEQIKDALVEQGMIDAEGRLQPAFDPKAAGSKVELPEGLRSLTPAVVDLLASYQIERHIRRERDDGPNRLKKEVVLSPEFTALWDRIKTKTTYRVCIRFGRWTISDGPDFVVRDRHGPCRDAKSSA